MPVLKEDVAACLDRVLAPDGRPLPQTGRVSDIVASDGKVFFSINVEAGAVPQWEPVRKAAETAVKAMPGVVSAMVALTAERAPASGAAAPRAPAGRQAPATGAAQHRGSNAPRMAGVP